MNMIENVLRMASNCQLTDTGDRDMGRERTKEQKKVSIIIDWTIPSRWSRRKENDT